MARAARESLSRLGRRARHAGATLVGAAVAVRTAGHFDADHTSPVPLARRPGSGADPRRASSTALVRMRHRSVLPSRAPKTTPSQAEGIGNAVRHGQALGRAYISTHSTADYDRLHGDRAHHDVCREPAVSEPPGEFARARWP